MDCCYCFQPAYVCVERSVCVGKQNGPITYKVLKPSRPLPRSPTMRALLLPNSSFVSSQLARDEGLANHVLKPTGKKPQLNPNPKSLPNLKVLQKPQDLRKMNESAHKIRQGPRLRGSVRECEFVI